MDFEGALRARLLAASGVTSLVGQRIYWIDRPQATALPAITLSTPSETQVQLLSGDLDGLTRRDVQVDCWARSYAEKLPVAKAAFDALWPATTLNGINFSHATDPFRIPIEEERTETMLIHRASFRLTIHYSTI